MRVRAIAFLARRLLCVLLIAVLLPAAPAQALSQGGFAAELQPLLLQARHPFLEHGDLAKERAAIESLYRQRAYLPLWLDASGALTSQASGLLQAMRAADELGLDPNVYEAAKIADLAAANSSDASSAGIDLGLSIMAVRFATHLHFGQVDPKTAAFNMPQRSALDVPHLLLRLAAAADIRAELASLEPKFQHYRLLKSSLSVYRRLAAQPPILLPPLPAKPVKPGGEYSGAAELRQLLTLLGDLPATAGPTAGVATLDEPLVEALKRFQFRHGLQQDGVLGNSTYAELATPLAQRVRQIELTLERWRWLPELDAPTIIVNIPQFRLFAFPTSEDSEANMVTMDVIVGTFPRTRTPVFAADMKFVKFRPYWDVPYSIMKAELLPSIRKNAAYLEQHDMEIVAEQDDRAAPLAPTPEVIAQLAAGKLRLRQKPGADNPLGQVKFMLPNDYNIYLHSTPARELFKQSRRAFSHGCIRVSDPAALADYVLRNAAGDWTRERIEAAMSGADNQRVDLKQWIRVLIVYGTAVATEAGNVYFFNDIYGNDARLTKLLAR